MIPRPLERSSGALALDPSHAPSHLLLKLIYIATLNVHKFNLERGHKSELILRDFSQIDAILLSSHESFKSTPRRFQDSASAARHDETMRVHHLNCGSFCPFGGRLMDGRTKGVRPARLVCHTLLIETDQGLVLVDTGLGLQDARQPRARMAEFFIDLLRPTLTEDETAIRQIEKLGFKADDVRHIVLTHLDFDHAGGLSDFPQAQVHLLAAEFRAATHVKSLLDIGRYRPAQWSGTGHWKKYSAGGDRWFGFDAVRDLAGLPPDILLIPLIGHTWGHSGVAVHDGTRWLLHAGDAYFYRNEMNWAQPACTPGLRLYQRMMEVDRRARLRNQRRLRELGRDHGDEVTIFSAHDRTEFDQLRAASEARERPLLTERRHELREPSPSAERASEGPSGRPERHESSETTSDLL
jgi:glyoxylase-like metal-dependent hydrolase (beta-lactamase superfamily II)